MTGTTQPGPVPAGGDPVALDLVEVSLQIEGAKILEQVSLQVKRGELLAVIGPNGAGKTSLINVISGAMTATSGRVHLAGRDVTRWAPHRRARAGLGRTFQTSNLFLGRTVRENVRLAAVAPRLGFLQALRPARPDPDLVESIDRHLDVVGLAARSGDPAADLSHGDRRKLELAMALAQDASVVLLDEPMAGVNSDDVDSLVELIGRVRLEQALTIVMVEHHMHVVLNLADRIAVMHHGALLAVDQPEQIIANPTVQAAYVGDPL